MGEPSECEQDRLSELAPIRVHVGAAVHGTAPMGRGCESLARGRTPSPDEPSTADRSEIVVEQVDDGGWARVVRARARPPFGGGVPSGRPRRPRRRLRSCRSPGRASIRRRHVRWPPLRSCRTANIVRLCVSTISSSSRPIIAMVLFPASSMSSSWNRVGDDWVGGEIVEEVHLVVVALLEALDGAGRSQCGEPAYGCRLDQAPRLEDVLERGVVQLEQEGGVSGRRRRCRVVRTRAPPPTPRLTLMSASLSRMRSASRTTGRDTS